MKQPRHCQVPDCAACEALDRYGVQEPRDESFFPVTQANPVARCIEIIREVRDGFLSEEYAVGQPLPSLPERFACDQAIAAIEEWFAASAGRNAERHDNADWRGRNDEHAVGSEADETPTPSPPVQDDDALIDRLSDLCRRVQLCWQSPTGQPPPRRPKFFTPEWKDAGTLLDAMIFIERNRLGKPDLPTIKAARELLEWCAAIGKQSLDR